MVVFTDVKEKDLNILYKNGFSKEEAKTIYELVRLRNQDVTLILYNSGKLLLQGKKEPIEKITKKIEILGVGKLVKAEKFRKETGWIIGSDETLKGDTFGGLVVAAVKADDKVREELLKLGVADSKSLSDKEILTLAEKIRVIAPCEIKSILPEDYNHNGNVTQMLNKLHQDAANYLKPGKHVVDKYPGCDVGEIQEEKAESKYIEVAAASILARSAGLKQLDYLTIKAGFTVPKGSTHVKLALIELKERRLDFNKFVKVSFRNVKEFL